MSSAQRLPPIRKRKNYLFVGSDGGGERAASIYTLVVTAKLNGLNPGAYLRDILAKIAEGHTISRIDELVPLADGPSHHLTAIAHILNDSCGFSCSYRRSPSAVNTVGVPLDPPNTTGWSVPGTQP